jgi:hypothetical protein
LYTSFIEALDEKGNTSSGIALGAGTEFDSAGQSTSGEQKISIVTGRGARLTVEDSNTTITNKLNVENSEVLFKHATADAVGLNHIYYKDKTQNAGTQQNGDEIAKLQFHMEDDLEKRRKFASINVFAKDITGSNTGSLGKGKITFNVLESEGNGATATELTETLSEQMIIDDVNTTIKTANIDLGLTSGTTINANGRFGTSLVPVTTDISNLGGDGNRWNELFLSGDIETEGSILPDTNQASGSSDTDIGSPTRTWQTVYTRKLSTGSNEITGEIEGDWTLTSGSTFHATYADLAEKYAADAEYKPGTVLVFGGEKEVTITNRKDDHRIAGVVSTNPAFVMNEDQTGDFVVDIALQGRVPCNVIGSVEKGDILVTSAIPGYAIVNNDPKAGRVIGKALENKDSKDRGTVEISVGRT